MTTQKTTQNPIMIQDLLLNPSIMEHQENGMNVKTIITEEIIVQTRTMVLEVEDPNKLNLICKDLGIEHYGA